MERGNEAKMFLILLVFVKVYSQCIYSQQTKRCMYIYGDNNVGNAISILTNRSIERLNCVSLRTYKYFCVYIILIVKSY